MILQRQIALLSFPLSNLQASKVRPVIVISNDKYNKKSHDIVVIPLTSNLRKTGYDMIITNNNLENLLHKLAFKGLPENTLFQLP